jgi:hypothetical protein
MAREPRTLSIDAPEKDVVPMFTIDARATDPVFTYYVVGARPLMVDGQHARNAYGNLLYVQARDGSEYAVTANTADPVVRARIGQALGAVTADIVARVLTAMSVQFTPQELAAGVAAYHQTGDNLFSAITRGIEAVEDERVAGTLRSPHIVATGRGVPQPPPEQ